jgi:hypothetical protein
MVCVRCYWNWALDVNYENRRVGDDWCSFFPRGGIFLALILACSLLAGVRTGQAQRGAVTLPRNLSDLSSTADRIVQGKVVAVRVEQHPDYKNLKTLLITLEVDDTLKGGVVKTFTFRQFIWDIRDISDGAGYRLGDEVLLFLNRPTSLGLISPVGLEQGRFRLVKSRNGDYLAINGNGNSNLLSGGLLESGTLNTSKLSTRSRSAMQGFKQGPIDLSALKESVRVLLQSQTGTK